MAPRTIKPPAVRSGKFTSLEVRKAVRATKAKKSLGGAKKVVRPSKKPK